MSGRTPTATGGPSSRPDAEVADGSKFLVRGYVAHPKPEKRNLEDSAVKLLDQIRQTARVKHFTYRTEQANAYRPKNRMASFAV